MVVDSSKLLARDIGISKGAHITAPQVKMLKVTRAKLGDVANNLKDNLVLTKVRNAAANKRRQEALRKKRETELENKTKKKGSKGGGIKVPGAGMLDGFLNGLITVLWGVVVVKMLTLWKSPAVQNFIKIIGNVGKVILKVADWLWTGFTTLIDWGYNLYDKGMGWVKNNLSEEAVGKIQTFMSNFKDLINGFLVWKLIGEKIFKAIVKNVTWVFRRIKDVFKLAKNALKQGARLLNWMTGGRAGNLLKNIAGKGKGLLTKAGVGARRLIGRGGRQFLKGGSSLMKKGIGGLAKRGALKVFGKTFVKTASKMFGRVPIIGPVIVGIASLLSGEPIGQALFKTFGAAIGGMLGTFIPVPILGTLLGEAVGVFAGDLLYHLIIKRDPKAAMKLFGDTMKGIFNAGKAVVDWIFGGGLFNLLKQGGSMLMKFGRWIFFTAIPWAAKKIGGIGKIIGEWMGTGMTRWVDTFPSFEVPNWGIQDLVKDILSMIWPKWVTDINILGWKPFGNLEGEPVFSWFEGEFPGWFENLPRMPQVLGFLWQNIPLLKNLVDDNGEVKRIPKIWNIFNPAFMLGHTKNAFFPGLGSESSSSSNGGSSSVAPSSSNSDAEDVSESASYEEGGEGTETIIPIPLPEVKKSSITSTSKDGSSSLPSGTKSNSGDPLLVLYMGK
jgi:uncharacterized protein YqgC (DUF456 family)